MRKEDLITNKTENLCGYIQDGKIKCNVKFKNSLPGPNSSSSAQKRITISMP